MADRFRLAGRLLAWTLIASFALVTSWSTVFVTTFALLGPPGRHQAHGWLGPTTRNTHCVVDIGKVNEWTCPDRSVFDTHRFGCRVWLALNGLAPGEHAAPRVSRG